jgi:hypothetical protein
MELSSPEVISKLTKATPSSSPTAANRLKIPRRAMSRRCQCGCCAACRDIAKWERIFHEKFEDPTYYALRPLHRGSSLGGLA